MYLKKRHPLSVLQISYLAKPRVRLPASCKRAILEKMNLPNIFLYFNVLVGLVALCIGIGAIIKPQPMALKFGIAADVKALPYVVSLGIRDVFMGLSVLVLFLRSEWFSLGLIHLCLGLVAVSDFLVVFKNGVRKISYVHLLGAFVSFIYGAWLLSYSTRF